MDLTCLISYINITIYFMYKYDQNFDLKTNVGTAQAIYIMLQL